MFLKDLTGQKFGSLTVLGPDSGEVKKNKYGKSIYLWRVRCDCGVEYVKSSQILLVSKKSKHCYACFGYAKLKKWDPIFEGDVCKIPIRDKFAIIDREDYELVKNYYWQINDKGYVKCCTYQKTWMIENKDAGKVSSIYLARLIMGEPKGKQVDHINHDLLNNRKSNLRVCTQRENLLNRKPISNHPGVYLVKRQYQAKISHKHLGCFSTLEEAIQARKEAEIKYFGDFRYKQ